MAELKSRERGGVEVDRATDLNDEKLCIRRCKNQTAAQLTACLRPSRLPGCNPHRRKTAPLMVVGVLEDNEPVRSAGAQKRCQKHPGIGAFRGAA